MGNKINQEKKKMNLAISGKNKIHGHNINAYHKPLTLFPLPVQNSPEEVCQSINSNLFQLERDIAFFNFAIKEIQDIT